MRNTASQTGIIFLLSLIVFFVLNRSALQSNMLKFVTISMVIFSILFFVDFFRSLREKIGSLYASITLSILLGITCGIMFCVIVLSPIYIAKTSGAAFYGAVTAISFGAIGYLIALANASQKGSSIGIFECVKRCVSGVIIGAIIGVSAHVVGSLFS